MTSRRSAVPTIMVAGVILLATLATAALGACAFGGEDATSLDGTNWELVSWSASSIDPADFTLTADFEDGRIGGTAAVNSYGGAYETGADGEFSIGPLASTMMAGSGDAGRAERIYFDLLESAASYEVVGDTLTLFDEFGDEALVFETAPAP